MSDDTKTCIICGAVFGRVKRMSHERWYMQKVCSKECRVVHYRQSRRVSPATAKQSRERVKQAMNSHWQVVQSQAAAKARPIPLRASREDEEDAIAKFIAERGVTRVERIDEEWVQMRHEPGKPRPMTGWRG